MSLIKAYGEARRPKDALNVVYNMEAEGVQPDLLVYLYLHNTPYILDIKRYSSLIDVLGKCGLIHQALKILSIMKGKGIVPSVVTYNSLIDAYGKQNDLVGAVKMLNIQTADLFSFYL